MKTQDLIISNFVGLKRATFTLNGKAAGFYEAHTHEELNQATADRFIDAIRLIVKMENCDLLSETVYYHGDLKVLKDFYDGVITESEFLLRGGTVTH